MGPDPSAMPAARSLSTLASGPVSPGDLAVGGVEAPSARSWWGSFVRNRAAVSGLALLAVVGGASLAAPLLAAHDPLATDPLHALEGPSAAHLLGTDNLGRDILSRLLFGSRLSLGTAVLAAFLVGFVGLSVGLLAGLRGGWVDEVCMRLVDGLLAFPSLVLVLAVAGTLGGGLVSVLLGFAALAWAPYARLVRGLALQLRDQPFVEAARAIGASPLRIATRHVLPSVTGPVGILLSIEMGTFVLAVSGLSFLGVGAHPPDPEWGAMLNDGRRFLLSAPGLVLWPAAAITVVVVGFNLVAEGLRDVLDPRGQVSWRGLRRRTRVGDDAAVTRRGSGA